jgi:hypothetical protein
MAVAIHVADQAGWRRIAGTQLDCRLTVRGLADSEKEGQLQHQQRDGGDLLSLHRSSSSLHHFGSFLTHLGPGHNPKISEIGTLAPVFVMFHYRPDRTKMALGAANWACNLRLAVIGALNDCGVGE